NKALNLRLRKIGLQLSMQQIREINRVNKQIRYHHLLDPVFASVAQNVTLKSTASRLLWVPTLMQINLLNLAANKDSTEEVLRQLLYNVGIVASDEALHQIRNRIRERLSLPPLPVLSAPAAAVIEAPD